MNMQISPTSTHSHQLRDEIGYTFVMSETPAILKHSFETVFGPLQF